MLVKLGKIKNPYFDPSQAVTFTSCLHVDARTMIARLAGQPYQRAGATKRGASRPQQNLPSDSDDTRLEALDLSLGE
ncbi:MAG: hypothetical protein R3E66_15615 [bacterium]